MAAPNTRTGFRQASMALRAHGLRPCRIESTKTPKIAFSNAKFAAVPLKRGLTDLEVRESDVVAWADTLTELVDAVAAKKKGEAKTEQSAESTTTERTTTQTYTEETTTTEQTEQATDGLKLSGEQAKALQTLLGAGVSEEKVREIMQREGVHIIDRAVSRSQEQWAELVNNTEQALREREKAVGEEIKRALETVVKTVVEIKTETGETKTVEGAHAQFPILLRELGYGNSVFLSGPAGSGKTTGAIHAAEALDRPYFLMRAVLDPYELLGYRDANGTYQDTPLYQWAKSEGGVLIMDEIDRSNPKAAIALNSAWNGVIPFPHEVVKVHPSNMIVATANTWGSGADAEYVGSCRLDAATLNRFPTRIEWGYDKALETRLAGNPTEAAWAQALRAVLQDRGIRVVFGPRDVIAHCKRVAAGCSRAESMEVSVLATLDKDTRQDVLRAVRVE